jgi:DNA-binding PadR family transcriptional regulator
MARTNKSQFALLGMLTLGPMTGYDIKKLFDGSLRNFWAESYGQIYPILRRLVEHGWATQKEERLAGRPTRKVYTITAKGRAALHRWLNEKTEPQNIRIEVLLKLFFGAEVPLAVSRAQVRAAKAQAERNLASYREIDARLRSTKAPTRGQPFWLMTVDYGLTYQQAVVDWCDRTLKRLKG